MYWPYSYAPSPLSFGPHLIACEKWGWGAGGGGAVGQAVFLPWATKKSCLRTLLPLHGLELMIDSQHQL